MLPHCRDFAPYGLGCYASANANTDTGTANTSYASTTTATIAVIPLSSGRYSFAFPSHSPSPTNAPISTTFVLAFPSAPPTVNPINSSDISVGDSSTTTSASREATTTTMTEKSALCFNEDMQSPAPCTADDGGFPGASTVAAGCRVAGGVGGLAGWVVFVVVVGVVL